MADDRDADRLKALEDRIAAAERRRAPVAAGEDHFSGAEAGWRMVTELLAGLLIGFGIGYGLDALFGTMPVFLILFVLFGFAAGVKVMLGTAKSLQETTPAGGGGDGEDGGEHRSGRDGEDGHEERG